MNLPVFNDEYFMREALKEAKLAFSKDEIPVGAVIVCNNKIIAKSHNLTQCLNDVTAHAEMQAFTSAAEYLGGKYLSECSLYVTLEPCVMCAGAAYWAKIGEIVFGASDKKRGAGLIEKSIYHPKTKVRGSVLEQECAQLISSFMLSKRK